MTPDVRLATTIREVRDTVGPWRRAGARIGLVPTMGALHEGHLSLVRLAADHADEVVVTVFVNPTQFDRADDLAAYPRDLDRDLEALRALGAAAPALAFAPPVEEMYPRELAVNVHVAGLSDLLEGASRPGHFDAVATVVSKLFNIVSPDVAVFGRKDFQQLQVLRRMTADLDAPVELVAGPTVRERDGLALSSRNRRLEPDQRRAALALSRGLRAAVAVARADREAGRSLRPAALHEAAAATLEAADGIVVDYLAVVDPDTLRPLDAAPAVSGQDAGLQRTTVLVAVAALVGEVRLIDNVEVGDLDDEQRLLDATAAEQEAT